MRALCPAERLHRGLEARLVDEKAALLGHLRRQVHGEAERVVEEEGRVAAEHVRRFELVELLVEVLDAPLQRLRERRLLLRQDLDDRRQLLAELRVVVPEVARRQRRREARHEARLGAERRQAVAHRAAQDAPEHVAAALVRRPRAVGDREGQAAHVVRDGPVGRVPVVLGPVVVAEEAPVGRGPLGQLRQRRREESRERVRVVVGRHLVQNSHQTLQPQARVDVLRREGRQLLRLAVALELDEDQIPDLDDRRVVHVHQMRDVAPPPQRVVVELRAGPAGARVAHLPEVVRLGARDDLLRLEARGEPEVPRLVVRLQTFLRRPLEVRRVHAVHVQPVDVDEQLLGPGRRLGLEVVAERPRPEHLEERVVVGVQAHVLEVVVLAARADALLSIAGPLERRELRARRRLAEEDGLELVHAGVREEQRRVLERDDAAARYPRVAALLGEVVDEGVAHPGHGPLRGRRRRRRERAQRAEAPAREARRARAERVGLRDEEHGASEHRWIPPAMDASTRPLRQSSWGDATSIDRGLQFIIGSSSTSSSRDCMEVAQMLPL